MDASLTAQIMELPQGQITRAMGDLHALGDPHYWLDPQNGRRIAKVMADKFSAAAPRRPLRPSSSAWPALSVASTRQKSAGSRCMAPFKGTKVVTYHRSFPNFADRFGWRIAGTWSRGRAFRQRHSTPWT